MGRVSGSDRLAGDDMTIKTTLKALATLVKASGDDGPHALTYAFAALTIELGETDLLALLREARIAIQKDKP